MKKMILCVLLSMALSITSFARDVPTDTVVQNLNGSQQAIKTFTIAPDRDPHQLIEEPFELGGFLYSFADIKKTENRIHENKMHTEVITVETAKDDLGVILEQLAPTLQYDDGTFQGTLSLDHTSIQTEVSGYTTKSSKTMDIQTIGQLDRNDMSYVPATTVKNGKTLSLENVEWQVTGTELVGDILVPCSYQAIATYSAKSSYKVATGYITTAEYVGTVSHEGVENVTYTLTYLGEEVLQEEADDGLWEKVKTFASDNWQYILCVLSLSAAMICMVLQIRLRKAIKGARSIEQENEAGEDDEDEEDLV